MKRLPLPVHVEDRPLAELNLSELELTQRFGEGHTPPIEPHTYPGPIKVWALMLDDGQVVLLEHDLTKRFTLVHAAPPDLERALRGLGIPEARVTWRAAERSRSTDR